MPVDSEEARLRAAASLVAALRKARCGVQLVNGVTFAVDGIDAFPRRAEAHRAILRLDAAILALLREEAFQAGIVSCHDCARLIRVASPGAAILRGRKFLCADCNRHHLTSAFIAHQILIQYGTRRSVSCN